MDLSAYYESIMKEPLLDSEEEKDLFLELHDPGIGPKRKQQIKDRIIRANLRFVFKEAKRYSKKDPASFEELISAGNEGLLVGLEKYNPDMGYKFLTYAGWWVKQRILSHMSSQRLVSLPIWRQQLAARIQKAVDADNITSFEELKAKFSDVPEKDLKELFETQFLTFYIEDLGEDPSFEINPIETQVHTAMDREKLLAAVAKLTPLEQQIIELVFGLVSGEETKPADIMRELDISRDVFKETKRSALAKLKEQFGDVNPFT